jgi:hypothetical protein
MWKGIVYSIFMSIAKVVVGALIPLWETFRNNSSGLEEATREGTPRGSQEHINAPAEIAADIGEEDVHVQTQSPNSAKGRSTGLASTWRAGLPSTASWAPAQLLGYALVARGEIG